MALSDTLARIPGLAGFYGTRDLQDQQLSTQLQQAGSVVNLQNALRQQQMEQGFRQGLSNLGPNASQEDLANLAAQYVPAKDVLTREQSSADRKAQIAATREATQGRLEQAKQSAEMMHEYRMSNIQNTQGRVEELGRHNREMEGLKAQGLDLQRSLYGIGPNGETAMDQFQPIVDAIGKGDMAPRTGSRNPIDRNIMNEVVKQYAGQDEQHQPFDATFYQTKQKTMNAILPATTPFNVGLQHLDTLNKLTDELKNSPVLPLQNKIVNKIMVQTGSSVAPTNFDAAKQVIGAEIAKAIVGAGGPTAESDRAKAQSTIDSSRTPQDLKGVIDTYKTLFVGKLQGLEQQYKAGTRKNDFSEKYLLPETRALYKGETSAPEIPKISNDSEYNALKSGVTFIDPKGNTRKKP